METNRKNENCESPSWVNLQPPNLHKAKHSIAQHYRNVVTNHLVWTFQLNTGPEGAHFKTAEMAAAEWAEYTPGAEAKEMLGSCVKPAHQWLSANGKAPTARQWRRWKRSLFGSEALKGQIN